MYILRYIIRINYIAKIDAENKGSYYLYNGHGDVVQTVDQAGTTQNQYDYDIWGNPTLTIETADTRHSYPWNYKKEFEKNYDQFIKDVNKKVSKYEKIGLIPRGAYTIGTTKGYKYGTLGK